MGKIISITNQKGGVGKTTTAINLSTALAAVGKKVLLIDFDPQGNTSTGFGFLNKEREKNIYDVLCSSEKIGDVKLMSGIPNLDIVTSTLDLAAANVELINHHEKEFILKKSFQGLEDIYDYIIIDCPPSLGLLTINALAASDSLIIPLQCEFLALEGLAHLLNTIELIRVGVNKDLSIEGILMTMQDRRNKLCLQVEEEARKEFGNLVYNVVIPRNIKLSEAPSHGMPAITYDTKCLGSVAYMMLAKEILDKQ